MKEKDTYTPFTPCIYYPVAQYQSTVATNEVTTAEFLSNVWFRIATLGTDESDGKIASESLLFWSCLCRSERKGLRISHHADDFCFKRAVSCGCVLNDRMMNETELNVSRQISTLVIAIDTYQY